MRSTSATKTSHPISTKSHTLADNSSAYQACHVSVGAKKCSFSPTVQRATELVKASRFFAKS
eukprot:635042-Pleurochrysis_carterae.AAC.2